MTHAAPVAAPVAPLGVLPFELLVANHLLREARTTDDVGCGCTTCINDEA
jgi:hypothetical protein